MRAELSWVSEWLTELLDDLVDDLEQVLLIVPDQLIIVGLEIEGFEFGWVGHDFTKLVHLGALVILVDLVLTLTRIPGDLHGQLVALVMDSGLIKDVEVVGHCRG